MAIDKQGIDALGATVHSDVEWLRDRWTGELDDDSLRRDSGPFRRLLIDGGSGDLSRLWRLQGRPKTPVVRGNVYEGLETANLAFATLDPVEIPGGAIIAGMVMYLNVAETPGGPRTVEKDLPIGRFLDGTCVVVDGVRITRRELVQYVANKAGGVHFDLSRDRAKDTKFTVLDRVAGGQRVRIANRDAVFGQLQSIGRSVVRSPDVLSIARLSSTS